MKPLFKTAYKNLPLSIPLRQAEFFDEVAGVLGLSRNTTLCLALRMGGPMLHAHAENIRASVREACRLISTGGARTAGNPSEILGSSEIARLEAINAANERTRSRRKRR